MSEHVGTVNVAGTGLEVRPSRTRLPERARGFMVAHGADLLALGGYAAVTVVLFWRIVGLGMVPVGYDLLTYFHPYKAYLAELVHRGELPLWNPMIFMGAPLLANIQVAALYPLDVLFYILPTTEALRYSIVLHLVLAAGFTYLFARISLQLSPLAAWVSGAVLAFGGFVGAHVGHINQLHTAVWLPALLLCLEQAVSRRSLAAAALGILAMSSQLLAGHTQEVYYSGWALGLFALYLSIQGGKGKWSRWRPLVLLAAILTGGAIVSAVQLLPTLELARESYRAGGIPLAEAVTFSVRPQDLLDSILPVYIFAPYVETIGYTAVVSLALLPAAATWRRHTAHWFFVVLGMLALMLSMGQAVPLYAWLHGWFPGFDLFRAPGRWLFVYSLSVAVVAGVGVEALRTDWNEDDLARWLRRYGFGIAAGVGALLAVQLWLASQGEELALPPGRVVLRWAVFAAAGIAISLLLRSRHRSRLLAAGLVVLLLLELYLAREPLEYNRPADAWFYAMRPLPYEVADGDRRFRMLSLAGDRYPLPDEAAVRAALPTYMTSDEIGEYLKLERLMDGMAPNTGMASGLASLDGYDGGLLPTRRYAELKHAILGSAEYHPDLTMRAEAMVVPDSKILGGLGVRYLLLTDREMRYDSGWEEIRPEPNSPLWVLRNRVALPRAFVVHAYRLLADEREMLDALRGLDISRVVLLDEQVDYQEPSEPGKDEVVVARDGANEVVVDVSVQSPGFLVLSDSHYPGWKVYVDDREARLLRANYGVRAVQLGSGSHRVRFAYEPLSFTIGLALSVPGLLGVGLALLSACIRRP